MNAPHVCNRIGHYVGSDRYNASRLCSVPIPDDMSPPRTLIQNGVRMELVRVEVPSINASSECTDWLKVSTDICAPVHS